MQLSQHRNEDVALIAKHFAPVLAPLPHLISQFLALKVRMRTAFENGSLPSLPKEPTLLDVLKQFHDTWDMVLTWEKELFGDVFPVIEAGLCAQDATAEIERGWAVCTHRKGLNRSHTTAEVMDDSMNVQCHDPTLPEWDPVPAAESWFISGKRGRRQVSTKSACKGKKRIQCQIMPEPDALAAAVIEQLGNWQPGDVAPPPPHPPHP